MLATLLLLPALPLAAQSQRVDQELAQRTSEIFRMAGGEFNINSPKQLSEILFDKLQLPASRKTGKTRTASTAVEVLEELGVVRHTHFHDGVAQFERTDEAPHHHMVCSRCGSDFELELDVLQPEGLETNPLVGQDD